MTNTSFVAHARAFLSDWDSQKYVLASRFSNDSRWYDLDWFFLILAELVAMKSNLDPHIPFNFEPGETDAFSNAFNDAISYLNDRYQVKLGGA